MGKIKSSKEFLLDCILILVVLQIARIGIKNVFLSILNYSEININIANIIAIMVIGISLFLFLKGNSSFNPAGYRLEVLSNRYDNKNIRFIMGAVALLSIGFALIKKDLIASDFIIICMSSLVIPIYEEFLFREYIWNYLNVALKEPIKVWIIVSVLAMIFTFGYWDIVSQLLEVVSSYKYTIDVVFSNLKIVILVCLASGFMKYKYKDIYLCIFAHIIINSIFF